MDRTATLEAASALPVEDQLELVFDLWDRIVGTGWKPTLGPELKAELDRRLAAYNADPNRGLTWEQVEAHVRRPRP